MAIMKIEPGSSVLLDPVELDRQAAWRERSVQKIKDRRTSRLEELTREREAIQRAVDAYYVLDRGDVPWVVLRSRFVRLGTSRQTITVGETEADEPQEPSPAAAARARRREIASRPPLTRLVHRQSNAMSMYLSAIFVAHLETQPGQVFVNDRHNTRGREDASKSWSLLAGLTAPREIRSRRARVRRALDELVTAGLVSIQPPTERYRYEGWLLLKEDGSETRYRVPSERESDAVRLPASFFVNGWHLVLSPGEIAMLLAIMDMARRVGRSTKPGGPLWIALPRTVRRNLYGLSGEMYLHAQQLHEFGLVDFRDPMSTRRRGKISSKPTPPQPPADDTSPMEQAERKPPKPVPYQYSPANPEEVFNRNAFDVVQSTLRAFRLPYRLDDNAVMTSPQYAAKLYLEAQQSKLPR
jgi:hypothetical protein